MGNSAIETGFSIIGKEVNAGKIGYSLFTPNTLDVVGAGSTVNLRKIRFWAEGGSTFEGNANINGFTRLGTSSSPAIKMKLLRGTLAGPSNTYWEIPHGLNMNQILGVEIHLSNGPMQLVSENFQNNLFWHLINVDSVAIGNNDTPAGRIYIGRKYQILITYQDDASDW